MPPDNTFGFADQPNAQTALQGRRPQQPRCIDNENEHAIGRSAYPRLGTMVRPPDSSRQYVTVLVWAVLYRSNRQRAGCPDYGAEDLGTIKRSTNIGYCGFASVRGLYKQSRRRKRVWFVISGEGNRHAGIAYNPVISQWQESNSPNEWLSHENGSR